MAAAPEDLTALLARWGIAEDAALAAQHGTNNQTFAVARAGRQWVLRISQNLSAAQVRAEHRLLGWLRRAGLPFAVPEPVPTLAGDTLVETPAGPATLCRRLPGVRPDLASELALERFGRAVGTLSEAMRRLPPEDAPHDWRRGDPLRPHPDAPDVDALCLELRAAGLTGGRPELLQTSARRIAAWWPVARAELPVQVVHGDLAASNTLTDERTGRVTALLDFEIAGADFRAQDFAVGLLHSGALLGPQWQRHTAAFVRGHSSVQLLSPAEIRAVPQLLAWRSAGSVLWRAGRWRRGQATLGEVGDRLDRLDALVSWLAHAGEQLCALAAGHGRSG